MKTFLITALFLLLSFSLFAQTTFIQDFQNSYDSATTANYDTLLVLDMNKAYDMLTVTVENFSATVACTLQVRGGTFVREDDQWNINEAGTVTDTSYYIPNIRDDSWTTVTSLIVAASGTETYVIMRPYIEVFKAYLTNTADAHCRVLVEGNP